MTALPEELERILAGPRDPRERTRALRDGGAAAAERVCWAASDYLHGLERPEFAAHWRGIDALRAELRRAVADWHEEQDGGPGRISRRLPARLLALLSSLLQASIRPSPARI